MVDSDQMHFFRFITKVFDKCMKQRCDTCIKHISLKWLVYLLIIILGDIEMEVKMVRNVQSCITFPLPTTYSYSMACCELGHNHFLFL